MRLDGAGLEVNNGSKRVYSNKEMEGRETWSRAVDADEDKDEEVEES